MKFFKKRNAGLWVKSARQFFLSAVLAITLFGNADAANLLMNGGFEEPALNTGGFAVFGAIPGWSTVSGPGIEIQDHAAGSPLEGDQLVELDSHGNSEMMQLISTVAGETYTLSFAYSPRPGVAPGSNGISIDFDGSFLGNITADGVGLSDTTWKIFTYDITATGVLAGLTFKATGTSDALGGYLDDVRLEVASVPEPISLVLMGSGLVGLLVATGRKQEPHIS